MRLRPAAVACLLSLSWAIGCERPRPAVVAEVARRATTQSDTAHPATAVADPVYAGPAPLDTLRLADLVAVATAPIDTLMTLGTWLRAHPRDAVSDDAPPNFGREEHLCRKASAFLQVGAWRLTRSAVFNLPQPPPGEILPVDTTRFAEQQCHLRAIWIDVGENDPRRAHVIADSLEHAVSAALGTSRAGYAIMAMHVADGSGKTWRGRTATVVLGIAPQDRNDANPREAEGSPSPPDTGRVLLVAYAPHSGLDPFDQGIEHIDDDGEYDAERELTWSRADSALTWAAVPRIASDVRLVLARLRAVYASKEREELRTPAVDSALVRLAIAMRDSVRVLQPPRRAAAMFAADVALAGAAGTISRIDTLRPSFKLKHRLEALGVPFEYAILDEQDVNTRPWLWGAYHLDSLGQAGRAAQTTLLLLGWGTRAECADGDEEYDRVIAHGEEALRLGATDPLIHYYVALGYHDIVSLSHGSVPEYSNPTKFLPLAPAARAKAIEHFRAVLAAPGIDRRIRRHSWRTAMALMLGRSRPTRFYCVYD